MAVNCTPESHGVIVCTHRQGSWEFFDALPKQDRDRLNYGPVGRVCARCYIEKHFVLHWIGVVKHYFPEFTPIEHDPYREVGFK
jgi:hypothetical protein